MNSLTMVIGNGYSGCTKEVDMCYTKDEWLAMPEKERAEIEVQILYENLDVYIKGLTHDQ